MLEPQEQAKRFELLRRCGIQGERRLMLARVTQAEHLTLVRELLAARRYWRTLGLHVDLAILHAAGASEARSPTEAGLAAALALMVRSYESPADEAGSGVFLIDGVQLTDSELTMLEGAVTAVFDGERGDMAKHLEAFHTPQPAGVKIRRGRATAYQG